MIAHRRILKEIALLKTCICCTSSEDDIASSEVAIKVEEDHDSQFFGLLKGPKDTPYEGGTFLVSVQNKQKKVKITIPDKYPFTPPVVSFITKVWHPNVSSVTGAICLDILKNGIYSFQIQAWSPALSIGTVLLSIQALLAKPEPNDPQDAVVAGQYKKDPDCFAKKASEWTKLYADGKNHTLNEAVEKLVSMGFKKSEATQALITSDGELLRATEILVEHSS